jgi:hypothetical protein
MWHEQGYEDKKKYVKMITARIGRRIHNDANRLHNVMPIVPRKCRKLLPVGVFFSRNFLLASSPKKKRGGGEGGRFGQYPLYRLTARET